MVVQNGKFSSPGTRRDFSATRGWINAGRQHFGGSIRLNRKTSLAQFDFRYQSGDRTQGFCFGRGQCSDKSKIENKSASKAVLWRRKRRWISRKCKRTLQRWYEILRTILVSRSIELARIGQLAPAKYRFEAVGLYPPTAETLAKPEIRRLTRC